MLVPIVSVTFIGLLVGVFAGAVVQHARPARAALTGLFGAFAGALAGAGIGTLLGPALPAGHYAALLGYTGAVLGALAFVTTPEHRTAPRR
ncbi:putative membrane protein YeaQ/YmgE (transglycosylase-associated protein family) [Nocardia transvalensis]|uniref:Putative membrane protein YeaQ/YmgE (Transglycosylase-associated protein family) n=1 Tax=Nocardia transvalensis TaxID=37333 RepID=A0A7W9PCZ4_9NOCA|nr:hypothetical protein [Nocardia transvalensis]MBB5913334.1 putative membrane protein YeaQ/YmgE (transglycosylase-associated protein family) [Nocardia transvalensis]